MQRPRFLISLTVLNWTACASVAALCIGMLSIDSVCYAALQEGQEIKERLIQETANWIQEEFPRPIDARGLMHQLMVAATSQGEFESLDEFLADREIEWAPNLQRLSLISYFKSAVIHGYSDTARTILKRMKPDNDTFQTLLDIAPEIAFLPGNPDLLAEPVFEFLQASPSFEITRRYLIGPERTVRFEGDLKAEYLDQIRFRYVLGVIDAKRFGKVADQIAKIKNQRIKDALGVWWLSNVPANQVFPSDVVLSGDLNQFAENYGRACHFARQGNLKEVFAFLDNKENAMHDPHRVFLVAYLLRTCLDVAGKDRSRKADTISILERLIPVQLGLVRAEERELDLDALDAAKQGPFRFTRYLFANHTYVTDFQLIVDTCDHHQLWTLTEYFANQIDNAEDLDDWLRVGIHGLAKRGNWAAAEQINSDYEEKFGRSLEVDLNNAHAVYAVTVARDSKLKEAKSFAARITDRGFKTFVEFYIAICELQQNPNDEAKAKVDQYLRLQESELAKSSIGNRLGEIYEKSQRYVVNYGEANEDCPYQSYLIDRFDMLINEIGKLPDDKLRQIQVEYESPGIPRYPINSVAIYPVGYGKLIEHVNSNAVAATKMENVKDLVLVLFDLQFQRASLGVEGISEQVYAGKLSGKAEKIIELGRRFGPESKSFVLRTMATELARQGDIEGSLRLIDEIGNSSEKFQTLRDVIILTPPFHQTIRQRHRGRFSKFRKEGGMF